MSGLVWSELLKPLTKNFKITLIKGVKIKCAKSRHKRGDTDRLKRLIVYAEGGEEGILQEAAATLLLLLLLFWHGVAAEFSPSFFSLSQQNNLFLQGGLKGVEKKSVEVLSIRQ